MTQDGSPGARAARNNEPRLGGLPARLDPIHDKTPKWPAYTLEQCATMFLDAECTVVNDPYRDEGLLWQEIVQRG